MGGVAIGIDIGGTNSKYGAVDRDGRVLFAGSIRTVATDPRAAVGELAQAVRQGLSGLDRVVEVEGVGVGAPNGNYYRGTVEHPPNLDWPGVTQLDRLFREHFDVPVFVTNDANAAALGELTYGAARGMSDFLMVTLGTGLGSGFVAHGRLIYGAHGFAGELGHILVVPGGRECPCGRRGCLERYASATGLMITVRELLEDRNRASALREAADVELTAKHVAGAAENGDPLAREAFDRTARILAVGLANAVAITEPAAIILFGGLVRSGELLLEPTRRYFEQVLFPVFRGKIALKRSALDEHHAAVIGAAALLWHELKGAG